MAWSSDLIQSVSTCLVRYFPEVRVNRGLAAGRCSNVALRNSLIALTGQVGVPVAATKIWAVAPKGVVLEPLMVLVIHVSLLRRCGPCW